MWGKQKYDGAKDGQLERLEAERDELKLVIKSLESDKKSLTEDVEKLKLKHKIADEDTKHLVKIREEEQNIEHKKRMGELEIEFGKKQSTAELEKNQAVGKIKDEYRDKVEKQLIKEGEKMQEMYNQILARLPDVNVMLGKQAEKED